MTKEAYRNRIIRSLPLTRLPNRIRNSYIAHEVTTDELPWVRPADFGAMVDLPRPVVVVNGAFDLLHKGHMKVIFAARQRGRTVVVAMDSDARVARKGPGRPIQNFIERATTLNYMPVDYIVEIESDKDMAALMENLRPDLRVQGFDHATHPTKYPGVPKCFVKVGSVRTSKIVERIKKLNG